MRIHLVLLAALLCFGTVTNARRMPASPFLEPDAAKICDQLDRTFSLSVPCEVDFQNKVYSIVLNRKTMPYELNKISDLACELISQWYLARTGDYYTSWQLHIYDFENKTNPVICEMAYRRIIRRSR